jgi:hypothetical protein
MLVCKQGSVQSYIPFDSFFSSHSLTTECFMPRCHSNLRVHNGLFVHSCSNTLTLIVQKGSSAFWVVQIWSET